MEYEEALSLVKTRINDDKLYKHMMAVKACMEELAAHFDEDKEKWAVTGLLHDIDYEETKDDPEMHGILGADYLKNYSVDEETILAIRKHAGHGDATSKMEISLRAADALSGLIVACALVHPEGLQGVETDFVMRKFGENRFAAGADREVIKESEKLAMELEDFVTICLRGMKKIAHVLSL